MQRQALPFICLLHMLAIFWWNVPQHYANIRYDQDYDNTPLFAREEPLLNAAEIRANHTLSWLLNHYIDLTGSQQYWDFFAPASPKTHQYFSVCRSAIKHPEQGEIICTSPPFFSNLNLNFKGFNLFKPNDSRWYRLTENLSSLNDPPLLSAFADFYQVQDRRGTLKKPVWLILHQFELAPGLKGLPAFGYRMDSVLIPGQP
ncbi:MAG: hypothetical protein ABL903_02330 [Methylococcales bacterium]